MVGVFLLNDCRSLCNPRGKLLLGIGGEGTWLVAELPCHNCRLVAVVAAGNAVLACYNLLNVVQIEPNGLPVARKGGAVVAVAVVTSLFVGVGGVAVAALFKVEAVTAAPVPCVVEVDYGCHAALLKLGYGKVEPLQNSVVEHTGRALQVGLCRVGKVAAGIGARKHSYVRYPEPLQVVELFAEPLPVASLSGRCQYARIPHVGAHEAVGLAPSGERASVGLYKAVLFPAGCCAAPSGSHEEHDNCCYSCGNPFHLFIPLPCDRCEDSNSLPRKEFLVVFLFPAQPFMCGCAVIINCIFLFKILAIVEQLVSLQDIARMACMAGA